MEEDDGVGGPFGGDDAVLADEAVDGLIVVWSAQRTFCGLPYSGMWSKFLSGGIIPSLWLPGTNMVGPLNSVTSSKNRAALMMRG